jgi:hypothetical protein
MEIARHEFMAVKLDCRNLSRRQRRWRPRSVTLGSAITTASGWSRSASAPFPTRRGELGAESGLRFGAREYQVFNQSIDSSTEGS